MNITLFDAIDLIIVLAVECVLLRKIFHFRRILMSSDCDVLCADSGCEVLHFEIVLKNVKFRIILLYRPPCLSRNSNSSNYLVKLLTALVDPHLVDTTVILGHFNLPYIDWLNSCARSDGIHDTVFKLYVTLWYEPAGYTTNQNY